MFQLNGFFLHRSLLVGVKNSHRIFKNPNGFFPSKVFCDTNQVKSDGDSKVFEKCPVNHVKGRQLPKENHHEQRYHKPSHLTERDRERELKVVDCINDFFHAPYACIAFDFLQFSQLLSFLKWKQQPVFHKLLHKKYQCHFTG